MTSPAARRPAAAWTPAGTAPIRREIIERALADVGILELARNRSPFIDETNRMAGVPEDLIESGRGFYCASWAGRIWRECGLDVPPGYGSCDAWIAWARKTGRWRGTPVLGAVVLYGTPADAHHAGIVVRLTPRLLDVEANTSPMGFSRNGEGIFCKPVAQGHVIGYVDPLPNGT